MASSAPLGSQWTSYIVQRRLEFILLGMMMPTLWSLAAQVFCRFRSSTEAFRARIPGRGGLLLLCRLWPPVGAHAKGPEVPGADARFRREDVPGAIPGRKQNTPWLFGALEND